MPRLSLFALTVVVLNLLFAIGLVKRTGMHLSIAAIRVPSVWLCGMTVAWVYYSKSGRSSRLALVTGSSVLLLGSSFCAAIVAHVGMRLRMPLIDESLARVDSFMGFDAENFIRLVAENDFLLVVLAGVYNSTMPMCLCLALGLSLSDKVNRTWELVFSYCLGLLTCASISVFYPALAIFAFYDFDPQLIAKLPDGSGVFHLNAVDYFRNGSDRLIDISLFEGVVTFPSFHIIMALICAFAVRGVPVISGIMYTWAVLVAISTIPIGGHYLVDIVAGFLLWFIMIQVAGGVEYTGPLRISFKSQQVR